MRGGGEGGGGNVKVKLDLCKKKDNPAGADTSQFARKVDLVSLQSKIDKLETTEIDLSKLRDVVKN